METSALLASFARACVACLVDQEREAYEGLVCQGEAAEVAFPVWGDPAFPVWEDPAFPVCGDPVFPVWGDHAFPVWEGPAFLVWGDHARLQGLAAS